MNADEFVALFRAEKDALLETYLHPDGRSTTKVGEAIASMNLAADQVQRLREVVDGVLTDAFYTVLMGLDGEASLGGQQRQYRVHPGRNSSRTARSRSRNAEYVTWPRGQDGWMP